MSLIDAVRADAWYKTIPIQNPFPIKYNDLNVYKIRQNQKLIPLVLNLQTYRNYVMVKGSFILFKDKYISQKDKSHSPE
jgi:uncharacterized protein YeeX (DUF496 family)